MSVFKRKGCFIKLLTVSLFVTVAVNLISSFDSIQHTIGGANPPHDDNQSDSLVLLEKFSKHICTDEDVTVKCVCGANTHPDYLTNMVKTYAHSRYDSSLFERCLDQTLPFDGNTPLECWPKMFILASYPTGGNELARSILQKTVKRNVFLAQYIETAASNSTNLLRVKAAGNTLNIHTNNCANNDEYQRSLPIGIMGRPGIYKTHGPKAWKITASTKALTNMPGTGGLTTSGIVHLTRNPGDQLLRDVFRWPNRKQCHSHECFLEKGSQYCDRAVQKALDWTNWHNFWIVMSLNTPQIIYRYEEFANSMHVTRATEKVMDFLDESPPLEAGYSLRDEINGTVKDPPYVQGTLMAQICGKDKARAVHEVSKGVIEQLGYVFDDDSATWSLSSDP